MTLKLANTLMADGKEAANFIHKTLIRVHDIEVKKRVSFSFDVKTNPSIIF